MGSTGRLAGRVDVWRTGGRTPLCPSLWGPGAPVSGGGWLVRLRLRWAAPLRPRVRCPVSRPLDPCRYRTAVGVVAPPLHPLIVRALEER